MDTLSIHHDVDREQAVAVAQSFERNSLFTQAFAWW